MRSGGTISRHSIQFGRSPLSGLCMMKSQTPPGRNSNARVVVVNPFGPHHRLRCLTSVNASNTRRRGPSMIRETTISRSEILRALGADATSLLLVLKLLHVLVQPVEALAPELLEPASPLVDRLEATRIEAVEPLLSRAADSHQPHLAEHTQVLGGARRRDAQGARQVVHRALMTLEYREDPTALRLGDRVEGVRGGGGPWHVVIICPYGQIRQPDLSFVLVAPSVISSFVRQAG